MKLSPHFVLSEFVISSTAQKHGIDNTPNEDIIENLKVTATLLERIRLLLGVPIIINSGYRSLELNKAVGGSLKSDHMSGNAVDIVAPEYGSPAKIAKTLESMVGTLKIGQLILEGTNGRQWVHISTKEPSKDINKVLTINNSGVHVGIRGLS